MVAASGSPPGAVCVVMPDTVVPGVDGEAVSAAWSLRQRQDGIEAPLKAGHSVRSCGEPVALVARVDREAAVTVAATAEAAGWRVDLAAVPAEERGDELALALAAALDARRDPAPLVSLDDLDIPTPPPAWRVGVLLGGQLWTGDDTATAHPGADLELRVAGLGERLSLGARLGWRPRHDLQGAVPASATALHAEVVAGWRWPLAGGLGLRLSGAAGAEWRWLTAQPPTRLDVVETSGVAPALSAELSLEWAPEPGGRWFLALSAGARAYPAGERRTFLGDTVMEAPVALGLVALRVGGWVL